MSYKDPDYTIAFGRLIITTLILIVLIVISISISIRNYSIVVSEGGTDYKLEANKTHTKFNNHKVECINNVLYFTTGGPVYDIEGNIHTCKLVKTNK